MNKVTHSPRPGHSQNCKPRRPFVSAYKHRRHPVCLVRTQAGFPWALWVLPNRTRRIQCLSSSTVSRRDSCSAAGIDQRRCSSLSTVTACKSPRQLEHLSFVIGHAQGGPVHAGRLNANRQREQIMSAQAATTAQHYRSAPGPFRSAASPIKRRGCATLIVDRQGNICGCGTAVEDILGASQSRLLGRKISALVADFFREGISPRYSARYLNIATYVMPHY